MHYLWMLTLILVLLLLLKIVSSPQDSANKEEDELPSSEYPPKVPILKSDICSTLQRCPDTDTLKEHRLICFGPPPRGHVYHCSLDEDQGIVVEFFYKKFPCRKGYCGAPEADGDDVAMTCRVCPPDRFNPGLRWSPENMDQCRSHYHKALGNHAIEYSPGNSTDPAVSYCDYVDGYASDNGVMFCREAYQPCDCVAKPDSCHGQEMLPDGSCEPWCDGQRTPNSSFSCIAREKQQNGKSSRRPEMTPKRTSIESTTNTEKPEDDRTISPQPNPSVHDLSTGVIIAICCAVTFVVSAVLVIVFKKRVICCKIVRNVKNIFGDNFDTRGAYQVNLAWNERSTSSNSGDPIKRDVDADAGDDPSQNTLLQNNSEA